MVFVENLGKGKNRYGLEKPGFIFIRAGTEEGIERLGQRFLKASEGNNRFD